MKRTLTVLLMVFLCVSLVIAIDNNSTKENKASCSKECVNAKVDSYKVCEKAYKDSFKNCTETYKQGMIYAKNLTLKNETFILKKEYIKNYTDCRKVAIATKKDCKNQTINAYKVCKDNCVLNSCQNKCGDGICQENVCMAIGCPCAENINNCAQDCSKKRVQCRIDGDCKCGVDKESGECFYGNKKYVNEEIQCPDFCSGISGNLQIKCIDKVCTQVEKTA